MEATEILIKWTPDFWINQGYWFEVWPHDETRLCVRVYNCKPEIKNTNSFNVELICL